MEEGRKVEITVVGDVDKATEALIGRPDPVRPGFQIIDLIRSDFRVIEIKLPHSMVADFSTPKKAVIDFTSPSESARIDKENAALQRQQEKADAVTKQRQLAQEKADAVTKQKQLLLAAAGDQVRYQALERRFKFVLCFCLFLLIYILGSAVWAGFATPATLAIEPPNLTVQASFESEKLTKQLDECQVALAASEANLVRNEGLFAKYKLAHPYQKEDEPITPVVSVLLGWSLIALMIVMVIHCCRKIR